MLAEMCERSGADGAGLVEVVGADPRIGSQFLAPGLGFGGGCLPKDLRSFLARGRELGMTVPLELIAQVDAVNRHQRDRVLAIVQDMVGGSVRGREVAVLGAAFKAGVDDIRDSPALAEVVALRDAGAHVRVHDPAALTAAKAAVPGPDYLEDVEDACRGAEAVLLLTDWPDYAALDPVWLRGLVAAPRLLDARLVVDVLAWRAAGWEVRALGRSA
ncbi:UDP binding domain-containing protein [Nocardioides gansuensis]|uniref:UDP binding domain-containing protein n=1 Tax=Nocardioides gansuensis TaxID=2138300 RepID=UPI001FE38E5D|nr:UDP binding domain-containing protein [Nocardioides gansuensis]